MGVLPLAKVAVAPPLRLGVAPLATARHADFACWMRVFISAMRMLMAGIVATAFDTYFFLVIKFHK